MFPRIESVLYVNNLEYLIGYLESKIYEVERMKERNKMDFTDILKYDSILLFLKTELNEQKE